MSKSTWLGGISAAVILGAFAAGCSDGAPVGEETGMPAPKESLGTESTTIFTTLLIPATPIPTTCTVPGILAPITLPAHWVERVPNNWGADYVSWNQRFADGYSIPFPTPWATPTSSVPDPYTYEHHLYWDIPSSLWWEYLVKDLIPPPPGSRYWTEGHSFFMVGITNLSDYSAANNLASQYSAPPVEAHVNTCVRIIDRRGNYLYDTGEYFYVFDEHDPINHPG